MIQRVAAACLLLLSVVSFRPAVLHGQDVVEIVPEPQESVKHDTSKKLKDMPKIKPKDLEGLVLGKKLLPYRIGSKGREGDGALQAEGAPGPGVPTLGGSFDGVGNVNGVLPPDPSGEIGPNHYVQMVNLSLAIWNRSGTMIYGPASTNTLWQGFGGPCETTNDGDPVVVYDQLADRWVLSQFALPNFPSGPFYECIAVSQTGDPTGAYHRYQFAISNTKLNDYPKFGVWPDGYYMAVNQFTCTLATCSWAGQAAVVFERDKMLAGLPAQGVKFDLFALDPTIGGMLPADADGTTPPPAGAPNTFALVDDNAWGYSPDQLRLWDFRVNWASPLSSTFTQHAALPTAAFDSNMCGYSRACIPQPNTVARVDAISDRLMYRLQYRNFGTHQTLVVNHTVDATGLDRAGVRWYELRNGGGGWSIFQQGTYSPDTIHRWMGSIAMNGNGDIGLGYSAGSGAVYPSIRATGRLAEDAPGLITQPELTIVAGTGHQTHASARWGDYSQMTVDPVDDCTFWYTQQYYAVSSAAGWRTRIGAFKLRDCGEPPPVDDPPTVNIVAPANGATVAGTVAISIDATDAEDAAGTLAVQWNIDGGAWQAAAYNASTGRYVASWNSASVGDGAHTVNARATDSASQTATDANGVTVDNVPDPPPPSSHVGDLDRAATSQNGNRWTATVTIRVHDGAHASLASATVTGNWGGGATGTSSCTTAAGTCVVSHAGLRRNSTASVTFTVTGVALSGFAYSAGANHDPDGDSNGTTITVFRP